MRVSNWNAFSILTVDTTFVARKKKQRKIFPMLLGTNEKENKCGKRGASAAILILV